MSEFTPGPWTFSYVQGDFEGESTMGWVVVGPSSDEWVCDCGTGGNSEDCARFIAAAPEMYDALKYALLILENHPGISVDTLGIKAALAKADGK